MLPVPRCLIFFRLLLMEHVDIDFMENWHQFVSLYVIEWLVMELDEEVRKLVVERLLILPWM